MDNSNCTITTCDLILDNALYFYRPSLAMNALMTALLGFR
jgi:hypothetical protein